ncbi:carotenoid biosynthesis protein [Oceanihabitans sp. IOP_32]|uniref:carotenoid biosynthesis protein n=1 Tax=Oceanihabitans sp. IOP_32 TaxID=2529032 RepID=UPI0012938E68|nr:carotenoid biosynthesis protein [Oceanihabitans sp. IOP_32]QFZ55461.1 carotenoid biosynthesis protein [Oceanihabitans sp. IOP_32]
MITLKQLKRFLSIFTLWLFTISGVFGILSNTYSDWFLSLTPLNLLITFAILLLNIDALKTKAIIALSIPFTLGFITEALGVNYGLIFGTYQYGENLGWKIAGVPIIICFNWALLTAASADVARMFSKNIIIASLIGGVIMTALDMLLEQSAPRFDFWEFENGVVPLQNYVGWVVTAFFAHLGYQYFKIKTDTAISWHILISIAVFFTVFLFF